MTQIHDLHDWENMIPTHVSVDSDSEFPPLDTLLDENIITRYGLLGGDELTAIMNLVC